MVRRYVREASLFQGEQRGEVGTLASVFARRLTSGVRRGLMLNPGHQVSAELLVRAETRPTERPLAGDPTSARIKFYDRAGLITLPNIEEHHNLLATKC